ncbi:hypothetical protein [Methylobacterium sp. Leaf91]|uniref:hypothetical protein n=1 Tax=Methylobacterium sp. Leaf91 TaxID=1736247 RepID=UPI0006FEB726|nr:hypothetical protein [Methylobacterium sp. Leaf91]KQO94654.1 hypothetical protein ASF32_19265 [Methylobacterium sp. Leaf91]
MIVPGKNETRLDRIIQAISEIASGGSNAIGKSAVTLAPGLETTVVDPLCTEGTLVVPVPMSASAAASGIFLKSTARGSFVLGHGVSFADDRVVRYELRRP